MYLLIQIEGVSRRSYYPVKNSIAYLIIFVCINDTYQPSLIYIQFQYA